MKLLAWKKLSCTLAACLLLVSPASADIYTHTANLEGWGGTENPSVVVHAFSLPELTSVNSFRINLAHSWAGDIDFRVTAPTLQVFDLTSLNGDLKDLGISANGAGLLTNVAPYDFVASGGADGTWDTDPNLLGGGIYNAEIWFSGSFAAGTWTFTLGDNADADTGAVSTISMDYTPVVIPEPGTIAILSLVAMGGFFQRRVRNWFGK